MQENSTKLLALSMMKLINKPKNNQENLSKCNQLSRISLTSGFELQKLPSMEE